MRQYRIVAQGGLRFSPPWGPEAAVFDPASTEILVVTELAARVLRAVQARAPASIDGVLASLSVESASSVTGELRAEVEAMLLEFERLGLVETAPP